MSRKLYRYVADDGGATQIEYALIAFFVSIAAATIMYSIKIKMQSWYWDAVNNLAS